MSLYDLFRMHYVAVRFPARCKKASRRFRRLLLKNNVRFGTTVGYNTSPYFDTDADELMITYRFKMRGFKWFILNNIYNFGSHK